MLKVSYKTIEEEGIDAFLNSYIDPSSFDPYNRIFCPPLEKMLDSPEKIRLFEDYFGGGGSYRIYKKNPSVEDIATYCISFWSYKTTNWAQIYPQQPLQFRSHEGLYYWPKKNRSSGEDGVLLTYRGSRLLRTVTPIIKKLIDSKKLRMKTGY